MVKRLTRMALVCLATLSVSLGFALPYVRILFNEDQTMEIRYGQPFIFTIAFTNTNRMWVYANDYYQYEEIPLSEAKRNCPWEEMIDYGDTIYEYDYVKEYTVIIEDQDGNQDFAYITYRTLSFDEMK